MITARQLSPLDDVPERLVRFGRVRTALSILVIEDDEGFRVEARCGRKRVERIRIGNDRRGLFAALEAAWLAAVSNAALGFGAAEGSG
jgi:hypothetical protein